MDTQNGLSNSVTRDLDFTLVGIQGLSEDDIVDNENVDNINMNVIQEIKKLESVDLFIICLNETNDSHRTSKLHSKFSTAFFQIS